MTYEEKYSKILEAVKELRGELGASALIDLYNNYAEANNYEQIYLNDEETLNNVFSNPVDAITHLGKDYKVFHDWCMFDGYGYLQSTYYPEDEGWICPEDITRWLMRDDVALRKAIDEYLDLDYDEMEV